MDILWVAVKDLLAFGDPRYRLIREGFRHLRHLHAQVINPLLFQDYMFF